MGCRRSASKRCHVAAPAAGAQHARTTAIAAAAGHARFARTLREGVSVVPLRTFGFRGVTRAGSCGGPHRVRIRTRTDPTQSYR